MRPADNEPPTPEDAAKASNGNDGEEAYSKKAKMVVRLVAGGFIVVGLMDLGLYWWQCHHDQKTPGTGHCVYLSIPLVIGVAILIKTPALARRIEDWLEE
jgi:hypothetical protein